MQRSEINLLLLHTRRLPLEFAINKLPYNWILSTNTDSLTITIQKHCKNNTDQK